jgi:hypothetical protein
VNGLRIPALISSLAGHETVSSVNGRVFFIEIAVKSVFVEV